MFDRNKIYLGITPTGWTNDDMPLLGNEIPFEQCVDEMALAGFEGCSIGHKYPTDPKVLGKELARRGLHISEPWTSTFFTLPAAKEQTIASCRERLSFINTVYEESAQWEIAYYKNAKKGVKADMVVAELGGAVHQLPVPALTNRPQFSGDQWKALVSGLNELGKIAQAAGMKLCYHPHVGTGVQNRNEIDQLMQQTSADYVHLLLDTGHFYYADESADADKNLLQLVKDYAPRIKHVHLKNVRLPVLKEARKQKWSFLEAMQKGIFTVPGDPRGTIDFQPILQALFDADYQGWLIVEAEQDAAMANPLEYAQMAHGYLQELIRNYQPSKQPVGAGR